MTTKHEQAVQLLRLPDADYFSFNQDRQVKLQSELARLVNNDDSESKPPELILALGSPTTIDVAQHGSIPVLIGYTQTGLRRWEINPNTNLHLFVRNLSTGDLLVAEPLINMRRGEEQLLSGVGTPPAQATAAALFSSVSIMNLREKIDATVQPGLLSVTAVINELRSNSVAINIRSTEHAPRPPQSGPQSYLSYQLDSRVDLTPKVDLPHAGSVKGNDPLPIHVSTQLSPGVEVPKDPTGRAFWLFHIILIKLDERPEVIAAAVPIQEIRLTNGRHAFNASFEVDAAASAKSHLNGKYQVYIDAGTEFLGPYKLTVSN